MGVVALALVTFNVGCRSLQPVAASTIQAGGWMRVEAPGGFALVGGQDTRCRAVRRASVIVTPDGGMTVSATRPDHALTAVLFISVSIVIAYMIKQISEDCCFGPGGA